MPSRPFTITLNACREFLPEFDHPQGEPPKLPGMPDPEDSSRNVFAPYTLKGVQVGAIQLLLYVAQELQKKSIEQERQIEELHAQLSDRQRVIDCSIAYLDPEQK